MEMMEREFSTGGHVYRAGRISVFAQMRVASQFKDVLIGLALLKQSQLDAEKAVVAAHKAPQKRGSAAAVPRKLTAEQYARTASIIMVGDASGTPPQVIDTVMRECFACVTRKEATGWQPIQTSEGAMQYADIELPQCVDIMLAVFEHNRLIDFFCGSPSTSEVSAKTEDDGQLSRTERTG